MQTKKVATSFIKAGIAALHVKGGHLDAETSYSDSTMPRLGREGEAESAESTVLVRRAWVRYVDPVCTS